ncbi:MAG: DUF4248 domain-containing protein [Chitinophagaceae bacterium]|nr:DUF4248 domain-containing protein [Chitinophagaceae bacterium]
MSATIKSYSKKEIAQLYGINRSLLYKWLVTTGKVFAEDFYKSKQIFTPKEVEQIFNHLGEPEKIFEP